MPIHKNESKFELVPSGYFQRIIITLTVLLLGGALIFLGFYFQTFQGSWVLFILAGLVIIGALIYLILYIIKKIRGNLECISIDLEGIRVYTKQKGTIKFLNWHKI